MTRRWPGAAVSPVTAPLRTSTVWPSEVRVLTHCDANEGSQVHQTSENGKRRRASGEVSQNSGARQCGESADERSGSVFARKRSARVVKCRSRHATNLGGNDLDDGDARVAGLASPDAVLQVTEPLCAGQGQHSDSPGLFARRTTHRLDGRVPQVLDGRVVLDDRGLAGDGRPVGARRVGKRHVDVAVVVELVKLAAWRCQRASD